MASRIYIETTIISYLAALPSRDLVTAAHQQTTREWWDTRRRYFELFVSQFVIGEAAAGDPEAAARRRRLLDGIPVLEVTTDAMHLARILLVEVPMPDRAEVDAFHIAVAVAHGVDYLLTWNCAHLANAARLPAIQRICRAHSFEPPVICTPEQLMEE